MENKKFRALRKKVRIKSKFKESDFRLSVFRSHRHLFAQIIEPKKGKTIFGLSDKSLTQTEGKTKSEKAKIFGLKFGKLALKLKIKKIVFDRGAYRYHGRVRAFAEGAREGGLKF